MIRNKVSRKLKSNDGASLMLALLFFVMCATVGSIILAAATASTGRLAGLRENNQTYYATSSAAELICNLIEEADEIVIAYSEDGSEPTYSPENTELSILLQTRLDLEHTIGSIRGFTYENMENYLLEEDNSSLKQTEFSLSINSASVDTNSLDTAIRCKIDEKMNLIVTIKPDHGDDEIDSLNNIRLTFVPTIRVEELLVPSGINDKTVNDDNRNDTHVKYAYIKWGNPKIEKGG